MITTKVVGKISNTELDPVEGAEIRAVLSDFDYDAEYGWIGNKPAVATTDANGDFEIDLWPNLRGTQGTFYNLEIRSKDIVYTFTANVPEQTQASLRDISQLQDPPPVDEAQLILTRAKNWARQISGLVEDIDYSAKAYAIGGTGVDGSIGSAKDWAIKTDATVDGTNFSAKYWATDTNVTTVSANIANITTVASIDQNVSDVASISAKVTDVADNLSTVSEAASAANKAQAAADSAALSDFGASTSEALARNFSESAEADAASAQSDAVDAASSASDAAASENAASNSASAASSSASSASSSASAAATSETNAANSAAAAESDSQDVLARTNIGIETAVIFGA